MPQQKRHSIYLSEEQSTRIDELTDQAGVNKSQLAYAMVLLAARIALRYPTALPPAERAPRGSLGGGRPPELRWTQGDVEYQRCVETIEGVGSDLKTALRWLVDRYVATGGDPLAMEWGPKRAQLRAA